MRTTALPDTQKASPAIGLRGIAHYIGELLPIDELPMLVENRELLDKFKHDGFKTYSQSNVLMAEQASISANETLNKSGLRVQDIDAIVIGTSELRNWKGYPERLARQIVAGLGVNHIPVIGATLAGCANISSSLRIARNMLIAEGMRNVLVIETNQVRGKMERVHTTPGGAPNTIFSDGAASFVVTTGDADFDLLAMDHFISVADESSNAAMSANAVLGYRHVIDRALAMSDLTREQIAYFLSNNSNPAYYKQLVGFLGFTKSHIYSKTRESYGHLWSVDSFVNLQVCCERNPVPAGTNFMLINSANSHYAAIVCRKRTACVSADRERTINTTPSVEKGEQQ